MIYLWLARYTSALNALRYGTFGPSSSSSLSQGLKRYFFISNDLTTIEAYNECDLFI